MKREFKTLDEELDAILDKYGMAGIALENAKEEIISASIYHMKKALWGNNK